jgi:hypothetical protein
MEAKHEEASKTVFLFDNTFLEFLYQKKVDLEIFESIKSMFDLSINNMDLLMITKKVYEKIERRFRYPYGEIFGDLYVNWENLIGTIYEENEFKQDFENSDNFLRRALSCLGTHIDKEDMDLFISASLLKSKQLNPIIISDDIRFVCYSDIISSYFGLYLRSLSTFELLTYLDTQGLQQEISDCTNHFELGINHTNLCSTKQIDTCNDFVDDTRAAIHKGVFAFHFCSNRPPNFV